MAPPRRWSATATAGRSCPRGGYFRFDIGTGAATKVASRARTGSISPRRPAWRRPAGAGQCRRFRVHAGLRHHVGARLKIFARVDAIVTQGDTAVVLDRGQTSVTSLNAEGTKSEHALRAARAPPRWPPTAPDGCWSPTPAAGVTGVRADPLILRHAIRCPTRPTAWPPRPGERAGVGGADGDEHRRWLRSGHRNPRREGAISNRAATELAGLRRCVGHPVRGVRLGCRCPGDPAAGAP